MNLNVNPAAPAPEVPLSTVTAGPATCEHCSEIATHTYAWPWGEAGKVCALHARLAQQTAENLQRQVTIGNLSPTGPAPITRDERSKLKGEVYALQEEVTDLKARGVALFNENLQQAQSISALTLRNREAQQQLREARAENEELAAKLLQRDAEQQDQVEELQRLRKLAQFVDTSTAPAPPGAAEWNATAGGAVVDG